MCQKESKLRFNEDEWADNSATAEIQHPAATSVPASSSSLLLSPDVPSHTNIGASLGSGIPFVEPRDGIGLPSPLLASSGSVFLDTPPQRPISSVGLATSRLHDHGFGGMAGFDRFGGTPTNNVAGASTTNSGFSGELLGFNSWIKSLNSNEQIVAVDLLLSDLNPDVLAYVEGKFSTNSNNIGSSNLHSQHLQQSHQQQQQQQQQQLNWDSRPHSAGPLQQPYQLFSPVADPSYLHRRALQLQLQNDSTHGHYGHSSIGHTMNFDDLTSQNVLKMNALNTITSRSTSDLKKPSPPLHSDDAHARGRLHQRQQQSHGVSASVPAAPRPVSAVNVNGTPMAQSSTTMASTASSDEDIKKTESLLKLASLNSVNHPQAPPAPPKSPMPPDITTLQLLNNIPAWLKALRLHKYTEILKHLSWKVMVTLNDEDLAQLGIATVGARRKLLKAFALVRECQLSGEIA